jgi:hypothetical protein
MTLSRNQFLKTTAAALSAAALPFDISAKPSSLPPRIKLSVSSYSYWHFKKEKYPIEKVIDEAAKVGVEGIDILHRQMESEDNAYIQKLKKHAFVNGIAFTCLSIHQSFVSPDKEFLAKEIDHTKKCIELAAKMGIPCLRLNSGRWGTIKSFDELMKARGVEPILPGYTEDDGFKWCIDSIQQCLPYRRTKRSSTCARKSLGLMLNSRRTIKNKKSNRLAVVGNHDGYRKLP